MKKLLFTIFIFLQTFLFAQEQVIDSAQYNIGYKIGENIPVTIILIIAIIIIIKSYRSSKNDDKKTDFLDDGSIDNK